ncbi:TPA: hypothetical protein L4H15_006570, partial [Pseudomonas aeruginosa]|nr:hypothetical protein [Pseudomonas aeruginosa]
DIYRNEFENGGCCLECNEVTLGDSLLCLSCILLEKKEREDKECEREIKKNMKKGKK